MCCSAVCPPFVNRVIEPQWHPVLAVPPLSFTQEVVINRHIKPQKPMASEWVSGKLCNIHFITKLELFLCGAALGMEPSVLKEDSPTIAESCNSRTLEC